MKSRYSNRVRPSYNPGFGAWIPSMVTSDGPLFNENRRNITDICEEEGITRKRYKKNLKRTRRS